MTEMQCYWCGRWYEKKKLLRIHIDDFSEEKPSYIIGNYKHFHRQTLWFCRSCSQPILEVLLKMCTNYELQQELDAALSYGR